jgi:hypothetical protein
MGHSRGGEGVMRHYLHNQLLGSPYNISAIFPLAPVDFNRPIINNVPFEVLLPYCDGDVSDLQGVHYYDDARYSAPGDMTPKHYLLVMGANHNFYNTIWTPGSGFPGAVDDWGGTPGDPHCDQGEPRRLTAAAQRGTGLAYMSAFFRRYVGGETVFDPILKGDVDAPPSAMTNDLRTTRRTAPASGATSTGCSWPLTSVTTTLGAPFRSQESRRTTCAAAKRRSRCTAWGHRASTSLIRRQAPRLLLRGG